MIWGEPERSPCLSFEIRTFRFQILSFEIRTLRLEIMFRIEKSRSELSHVGIPEVQRARAKFTR